MIIIIIIGKTAEGKVIFNFKATKETDMLTINFMIFQYTLCEALKPF